MGEYLRDVWRRREFAVVVPAQDLRAQNMDTALGQLWHLVNPALLVGVYFLIFGVLLDTRRGVDNFLGFLIVGVVLFHLIQRVVQDAAVCIVRNLSLIRSIQFPRILLPMATVNGQTLAFLPALAVALLTLLATGERPTPRWLLLAAVLVAAYVFNLGAALVVARVGGVGAGPPEAAAPPAAPAVLCLGRDLQRRGFRNQRGLASGLRRQPRCTTSSPAPAGA